MALLDTYLQNIRAKYPSLLDRDELRIKRFGLVSSAFDQTNSVNSIITPDLKQKAMNSVGRTVQVPVLKDGIITVGNVRSCTISAFENSSALVALTWATITADISMTPAQYAKNEIGYVQDLARKLVLVKEGILNAIETAIYAKLDAEKSTVFASTLIGVGAKYPLVADTLQVSLAKQQFFFNDIQAIQLAGDFVVSPHWIEGSVNLMPTVEQYINQGAGNSTNTTFQFADKTFRFSNGVVDGAGVNSTGFFMQDGTLGILTRVDLDAQAGSEAGDGTEWGTIVLPGMPFEIGYQYKSKCKDESALNGSGMGHLTATLFESWQFSVDYALLTPYNSDPATLEGVIKKFEFLNA